MIKRLAGIAGALVLTIALAAFTASALAGNGNGNGTGNSHATSASQSSVSPASPGNSANAPGHTTSQSQSGHMQNSSAQPGVKPDSNTQQSKNTTAPATSNKTKLYGNGKAAGQIAQQYGYTGDLYGPGNSQPHKVQTCAHPHGIDVHALKSHAATANCTSTSTSQSVPQSGVVLGGSTPLISTTAAGLFGTVGANVAAAVAKANGGVLGATASSSKARGAVLGALVANGKGTLPFTGFPIWLVALIGAGLMVGGLGLRRSARGTI